MKTQREYNAFKMRVDGTIRRLNLIKHNRSSMRRDFGNDIANQTWVELSADGGEYETPEEESKAFARAVARAVYHVVGRADQQRLWFTGMTKLPLSNPDTVTVPLSIDLIGGTPVEKQQVQVALRYFCSVRTEAVINHVYFLDQEHGGGFNPDNGTVRKDRVRGIENPPQSDWECRREVDTALKEFKECLKRVKADWPEWEGYYL